MPDEVVKVKRGPGRPPKGNNPTGKGLLRGVPKGTRHAATLDREARFVDEYMTCFSAAEAARRIGIKKFLGRRGYDLLHRHPDVRKQIRVRMKALRKKCDMESVDVLLRLIRNEDIAFAAGDLNQSTRCLELMGKSIAMFTDKIEVDAEVVLGPRRIVFLKEVDEVIDAQTEQITRKEEQKCLPQPTPDGT